MSQLATLLEQRAEALLRAWIERLTDGVAPDGLTRAELRDHIPQFLVELTAALRVGRAPESSEVAKAHGRQREALGFDLEALVREYGLLRATILDVVDAEGIALTSKEVRVLTDFVALAVAEGVVAHGRYEHTTRTIRERDKLSKVLSQAAVPIAIIEGPEHVYTFANPAYVEHVYGRDVVGRRLRDVLPGGASFEPLLDEVKRTGEPYRGTGVPVSLGLDGSMASVDFVITPLRGDGDQIHGVIVSANDVTSKVREVERVEALAAQVRERETQLRNITDAIPVLVSWITPEHRYGFVNRAYEEWFERPRAVVVGRHVAEVIGDAAYAQMRPFIERGLRGEALTFEQHAIPYRTGGTRDVRATFSPFIDASGLQHGFIALLIDITEERRLAIERERFSSERAEVLERQAEFEQQLIGIVSHDLRNPLNVVVIGATLLTQLFAADPKAVKVVDRMMTAAHRATRLVSDLLDFTQARIGGGLQMSRVPADLEAIVRTVVDEVEAAHPGRRIEVAHTGDTHGTWDPSRLEQVVQNLVTNALKYSPADGIVRIATAGHDDRVTLSLHNRGATIPADKLPTLFEPFQRVSTDVENVSRSVGLGLYIVTEVVRAHGGTVGVRSNDDDGTTFTVELPR